MPKLLLAGDIGGTKTLVGLFERTAIDGAGHTARPLRKAARAYGTLDHQELADIIADFLDETGVPGGDVDTACFGVAGPVIDEAADLTNVPWRADARSVRSAFGFVSVRLLNDLEAMAYCVPVLDDSEVHVLQAGVAKQNGHMAIIAAGTGLGEALLHDVNGRWTATPTEAGHADFAARTDREMALVRDLTRRYGRADVEHVISGRGLINIHRVSHRDACVAVTDLEDPGAAAAISAAALERRCAGCMETLDLFIEAYGAEAGNLGLRSVATGGVFIGGGIAPKILPALTAGSFMRAFCAKPPLDAMVRAMPVKVILNEEAGLLGAAVFANSI
jgi:glucokinase